MFWYNWTYMVVIGKKLQTNEKLKRWLTNPNRNFNETNEPRSVLTSQTRPPMKTCHCQANKIPKIWLSNGSVNSKRAHPPWAFVILFWKSCKCPTVGQGLHTKTHTVGLENRVQMSHPGTTPKLYFPVNKLQIPYLWEISNNLIKAREAPYANRSCSLVIIIAKKITSNWLISMTDL